MTRTGTLVMTLYLAKGPAIKITSTWVFLQSNLELANRAYILERHKVTACPNVRDNYRHMNYLIQSSYLQSQTSCQLMIAQFNCVDKSSGKDLFNRFILHMWMKY